MTQFFKINVFKGFYKLFFLYLNYSTKSIDPTQAGRGGLHTRNYRGSQKPFKSQKISMNTSRKSAYNANQSRRRPVIIGGVMLPPFQHNMLARKLGPFPFISAIYHILLPMMFLVRSMVDWICSAF